MKWYKFSAFFQMMGISVSTLIPLYWREILGYEAQKIGFLNALAILIALTAPLFFGWYGTSRSLEKIIRLCFWLTALCAPFFLGVDQFWLQVFLFGGVQFFRCGFLTLVPVGVLQQLGAKAGSDYGKYRRVGSIGFLIGVIGGGYLTDLTSPSWIFAILGGSAIIASIPYIRTLQIPSFKQSGITYQKLLAQPGLKAFYLGTLFLSTWSAAGFLFLPLRMREMNAGADSIGWVISECGIVALFTLNIAGKITDRIQPQKIYPLIPFFAMLRIFCYSLPDENYQWFFAVQLLHIPVWVMGEVIQIKFLRTHLAPEWFSRSMALLQVSQSAGLALGSAAIGYLSGLSNLQNALAYSAFLPGLALPFFFYLKKRRA